MKTASESTEFPDYSMQLTCSTKDDYQYMFSGDIPIPHGNPTTFGNFDNVVFWELQKNGKSLKMIPKNIDKMKIEWVKYKKGSGEYNGKNPILKNIVDQISKMKFVKEEF